MLLRRTLTPIRRILFASLFPKLPRSPNYIQFSSQTPQTEQIPQEVIKILQTTGQVFSQLYNLGRYQEASKVNEEYALQLEMMEFPQGHPAFLTYLNNKALLLKNDGKYQEALQIYQDVLVKYRQFYKASTPSIAVVLSNLATLKQQLGKPEDALQDVEEAITIKTNTKADQVSLALSVAQKASILKDLKQFQEAHKLLRGALEVVAISKGEFSLESMSIISDMALLQKAQGNYSKAEDDLQRVIQTRENLLGGNHPNTLAAKHNLGEVYRLQGKVEQAERLFDEIGEQIKEREEQDKRIFEELKEEQRKKPEFNKMASEAKKYEKVRNEYLSKRGKRK